MKTSEKKNEKRMYNIPEIQTIKLDKEISLAMESAPPDGPGEIVSNNKVVFGNSPFGNNIA